MAYDKKQSASSMPFNIHWEAKMLAWYRDNGLAETVRRRLPELAVYEKQFGRLGMAGKLSREFNEDQYAQPVDLAKWCIENGGKDAN